jgi:hypothetical protein
MPDKSRHALMNVYKRLINQTLIITGIPFGLSLSKPFVARPSIDSGRTVFRGLRVNSKKVIAGHGAH